MNKVHKKCPTCGQTKGMHQFYNSRREKDGKEYQCSVCASARQKLLREENWNKIKAHYGGRCFCCGEDTDEFLTIDHVHKDGALQRKLVNRGRLPSAIVRDGFPDAYRIACMNCNLSLGLYGYCPHSKPSSGS